MSARFSRCRRVSTTEPAAGNAMGLRADRHVLSVYRIQRSCQTSAARVESSNGHDVRIVLYAGDKEMAKKAADAGLRVANSTTASDTTSELVRLARRSPKEIGEPVKVSGDLFFVLTRSDGHRRNRTAVTMSRSDPSSNCGGTRGGHRSFRPKELPRAPSSGTRRSKLDPRRRPQLATPGSVARPRRHREKATRPTRC